MRFSGILPSSERFLWVLQGFNGLLMSFSGCYWSQPVQFWFSLTKDLVIPFFPFIPHFYLVFLDLSVLTLSLHDHFHAGLVVFISASIWLRFRPVGNLELFFAVVCAWNDERTLILQSVLQRNGQSVDDDESGRLFRRDRHPQPRRPQQVSRKTRILSTILFSLSLSLSLLHPIRNQLSCQSVWLLSPFLSFVFNPVCLMTSNGCLIAYWFTWFYWVLLNFTEFEWVLPGLTGFYWVLLSFTEFYWVLLGFTGF